MARRWRLLLAHDASASTCDFLLDAIEGALGNVDVSESSSIDDARVAVVQASRRRSSDEPSTRFHLAMVCLDLPPAPLGGVRLAQELLDQGLPVILVTRSLRWIPASAAALLELPWIPPDAGPADVSRAVGEAMALVPTLTQTLAQGPRRARGSERPGAAARVVGGE